jgi:hypothetical protein
MIKFFRKIRQKLLIENKFSKYLLYAFGEIVLVVIGILIALQLNIRNEIRKTRNLETKTLIELRSDLMQNIDDIERNIVQLKECKKANEVVIYHMENNLAYNDSLDSYFANLYPYVTFSPIQTTFNYLNQNGIKLLSNDSLRANISDLYANQFSLYKVFESTYLVEHHNNYVKPMFMTEFETFELYESFKPRRYSQFIKNEEYKQIMNYTVENCDRFITFQSRFREYIEDIIFQIDNEIAD